MNNKKISINELFSGIGAQRKALLNLGYDVDVIGISEIDKYAIQSYESIFGETRNYGDISKVEKLNYADMWTYSFPCQDISVAGYQNGINNDTRSGLLYQVERLLENSKKENLLPKYLLLENVKNLVGKKFKKQFDNWLKYLNDLGYNNYWQILNARDYGIPQNRERVFVVSIRKDISKNEYIFPEVIQLKKYVRDIIEKDVNEKYYLSEYIINKILNSKFNQEKTRIQNGDICQTLLARDYKDPKCIRVENKIRKLTPKEYWRLMGFDDEDFDKAKLSGISNSQLYKQAGNSIVVDVLERIFENLLGMQQ